jgi:membrane associated rhomboid family serine protease
MSLPPPPPPPGSAHNVLVCYRHPNREAGRSCTRCGKSACSECLVQATVGSHCVDCAKAARPDVRTRARFWNARQTAVVTLALIAINVAVFVLMVIDSPDSLATRGGITRFQFELGLNEVFIRNGRYYRLITAGFLHFGVIHIAFNMLLLYQLGNLLEPVLGRLKYTALYFAALLAGSFGAMVFAPNGLTGGASGAVFGLMAAAAVGMQRRGINMFSSGIGTTLILNLVLTFTLPNISIGGHLGGAAAGAVCGWVMLAPHWKPQPKWVAWATPVAIAVGSVIAAIVYVRL